jgi:gluconate 2-dehydrogenase gamma chain
LCAAACERILPADADPGAIQLGVVDYIDGRLAREGRRVLEHRQRFRRGLARLNEWSRQRAQREFTALEPGAQDQMLASLAAEGGEEGYAFVKQLTSLTMEGAFADPSYGGNRGKGGWALLGFDAPCPNPRCE